MVRWRRPDAEPADDDGLLVERAVWLQSPHDVPPAPATPPLPPAPADTGGAGGAERKRAHDSWDRSTADLPAESGPRHAEPAAAWDQAPDLAEHEPVTPARGAVYLSESYPDDDGDLSEHRFDEDRPPRRRRLIPLLAATALLGILGALGLGALTGPGDDADPHPSDVVAAPTLTRASQLPFQPLDPSVSPSAGASPSASASVSTVPTTSTTQSAGGVVAPSASSAPSSGPPTFTATSGPGCANTVDTHNWYTNGEDGAWWTGGGGASACGGAAVAMPSSGSTTYETEDYIVWWFETSPVVTGTCVVDVYIPNEAHAAGKPALYKILGGRTSSTVITSFTIDQTATRGSWVRAKTVAITGGGISVHLTNRGGPGVFLAAAQVRVTCAV